MVRVKRGHREDGMSTDVEAGQIWRREGGDSNLHTLVLIVKRLDNPIQSLCLVLSSFEGCRYQIGSTQRWQVYGRDGSWRRLL